MDCSIDYLYDFSRTITNHIHDWGTVGNRMMFVDEYCNNNKLDGIYREIIDEYSKHYLENELSWFPAMDELEEWYIHFKKKKK